MQIIKFERSCGDAVTEIKSSEDFKALLDSHVKKANWKRLYKYKCGDDSELRCFKNEFNETATIAENGEGVICIYVGVNIQEEIKAIRQIAKWYWTDDYGEIY